MLHVYLKFTGLLYVYVGYTKHLVKIDCFGRSRSQLRRYSRTLFEQLSYLLEETFWRVKSVTWHKRPLFSWIQSQLQPPQWWPWMTCNLLLGWSFKTSSARLKSGLNVALKDTFIFVHIFCNCFVVPLAERLNESTCTDILSWLKETDDKILHEVSNLTLVFKSHTQSHTQTHIL